MFQKERFHGFIPSNSHFLKPFGDNLVSPLLTISKKQKA